MKKMGFRGWRKMARDREGWKIIVNGPSVMCGLEEKKESFNDQ